MDWIGNRHPELLAKDKFERFEQLLKAPIQTIELTESIYSRLFRVFKGQDSFFNYQFTDDTLEADWAEYREDKFWPTIGFQAMQTAIDSVWIPEIPEVQQTEFPEPVNRLIDIKNVISILNDEYNNCIYVIFQIGNRIFVYDDQFFRVYDVIQGNIASAPAMEVPHDLGYTPARMMWSERLKADNFVNKEAPVTKELTDLDWLLFHMTSKRYMDLSVAYPTVVSYDNDEEYTDDRITDNEQRKSGKKPSGSHLMGAGSHLKVDPPRGNEDSDMLQYGPIKIISPDTDSLNWHVQEEIRLIEKIFKSVVGTDMEVKNDAAKNEKQIDSAFESQESVLFRVKKNFEIINKFADATIARLRYGDRFIDCEIDYGTNFLLKDVSDLQEELQLAKKSGAGVAIIEAISDNIINTKYRDDRNNISRAKIIGELDPLPTNTVQEAMEIFKNGGIDKINFIIKSNLINFVRRFERENTDIVRFGSLGTFGRKVDQINEEFKKYANEFITETPGIV
jgi:hypothetical protein